jgi:hypothetical protein
MTFSRALLTLPLLAACAGPTQPAPDAAGCHVIAYTGWSDGRASSQRLVRLYGDSVEQPRNGTEPGLIVRPVPPDEADYTGLWFWKKAGPRSLTIWQGGGSVGQVETLAFDGTLWRGSATIWTDMVGYDVTATATMAPAGCPAT